MVNEKNFFPLLFYVKNILILTDETSVESSRGRNDYVLHSSYRALEFRREKKKKLKTKIVKQILEKREKRILDNEIENCKILVREECAVVKNRLGRTLNLL